MGWLTRRRGARRDTGFCSAVVVAAGASRRMGQDKILAELGGIPVIARTLLAFERAEQVDEIVVVTREDQVAQVAGLCRDFQISKATKVIRGGATRTQSARMGTLEAAGAAQLIAIHDGARPLVSQEVIAAAIGKAAQTGAAAPAVPVKDTIKQAAEGVVERTLDRSTLYAVQTPQVFEASLIRAALQKALEDGVELTDDCAAVERLGMRVWLTPGRGDNLKLTTPEDLIWAEGLLEREVV